MARALLLSSVDVAGCVLPLMGMASLAGGCFNAAEPFRASGVGFGSALDGNHHATSVAQMRTVWD